jgi:hypothetical protein
LVDCAGEPFGELCLMCNRELVTSGPIAVLGLLPCDLNLPYADTDLSKSHRGADPRADQYE